MAGDSISAESGVSGLIARPTPESEREIEIVLGEMSWDDKLAQLQIAYRPNFDDAAELVRSGIGAVFWPGNAEKTNELQRIAREETPHGIPLLVGLDVIHGQYTIFPTPLAQASSFDPEVAASDARVSAIEATSGGVNWTFSPMVDVSTDPRWGRVVEGFGEDPFLAGRFGAAKIAGYQGVEGGTSTSLLACAKHFVAYGLAEGGRDYNTVDVSENRLRNTYLVPFRDAVKANVASVMASFNTVGGRPMHSHERLLTDVLKREWGHEGIVVGDAEGVVELVKHGVAEDESAAIAQSLRAGLDVEMGGHVIDRSGHAVVSADDVPASRIDDAVRRVLRLKHARGLFDYPFVQPGLEVREPDNDTRRVARRAAGRCAVLLKNDGALPIPSTVPSLLIVGPYAESTDHLGAWTQSFAAPARSIADCLREALPATRVTTLTGAGFFDTDRRMQVDAARAALEHDFVVVAVGEPSSLSGEASSRSDITLTGDQAALILAIAGTGVPFAVVLVTGRPLVMSEWIEKSGAVLLTWHLGTEAPEAIVDLLLGAVSPGGKLAMSIPRSVGQIPIYYNHESTGRAASIRGTLEHSEIDVALVGPGNTDDYFTSKYLDLELGPQFEFGHGLSYTSFEMSAPEVLPRTLDRETLSTRGVRASVSVTNTGAVLGDEVVQLYIHDLVASIAQPVRRLRGFRRVTLEPGQSATVEFVLGPEDLGFWGDGASPELVVEPGDFEIFVGGSLASAKASRITLVA
ncbi:glycoside hydrolase family 3 N-terminal domain-containing protein [Lacisediminihabitans sp.]|uniref:glycoside hydrolase family 3 N-terminal domain-containing protein n=1 Tax=Lacisediminihabitans sp. TaxID=2787631 RepID=UPI00374DCEF5